MTFPPGRALPRTERSPDAPVSSCLPGAAPVCVPQALRPGAGLQAEGAVPRELQRESTGHLPGGQWFLDRTHLFLCDKLL